MKDTMVTTGARTKLVPTARTISENVKTYFHWASERLGGRTAGGDQGSSGFTSDHMIAMKSGTAVHTVSSRMMIRAMNCRKLGRRYRRGAGLARVTLIAQNPGWRARCAHRSRRRAVM